jgi:hypothetical protein
MSRNNVENMATIGVATIIIIISSNSSRSISAYQHISIIVVVVVAVAVVVIPCVNNHPRLLGEYPPFRDLPAKSRCFLEFQEGSSW